MRIVSSTGFVDLPYGKTALLIKPDGRVWAIFEGREFAMTEGSSIEECKSEMYQVRMALSENKSSYRFGRL